MITSFYLFAAFMALCTTIETIFTSKKRDLSLDEFESFLKENPEAIELVQQKLEETAQAKDEHEQLLEEAAAKLLSDPEFQAKAFDRALNRNEEGKS